MKARRYTLITGASRGLGKSFASVCAGKGMHLILIALKNEGIFELASLLTKEHNIEAIGYEADFTNIDELKKMVQWININYNIHILINNAGTGGSESFQNVSSTYIDNIMLLNIRALVLLTHGLLPNLEKQPDAYILNIASMASFGPMPYKTVYPASKAFVYSFSRGLYSELKNTSIFVSVAHPGGMATNPDVTFRINQYGSFIRSLLLSPDKTAEICIRQLLKKDSLILPGFINQLSWLVLKVCPVWIRLNIFRRSLQKEIITGKQRCYA